jgi:hypothetical protein
MPTQNPGQFAVSTPILVARGSWSALNALLVLTVSALLLAGCAGTPTTNPPRSATEQLLLSTAADRALASTSLAPFNHKKVFIDASYFDSYDSKYVLGAIRDAFSQTGALIVSDAAQSDFIVEARSGALSTDFADSLIGIPKTGVPIPLSGAIEIPELALFKSSRQHSTAKFALLAYATNSREHFFSSGSELGTAYNKNYKLLGIISWNRNDIPERQKKKSRK